MNKKKLVLIAGAVLLVAGAALTYYLMMPKDGSPNGNTTTRTCTTYGNKAEEQCIEDYVGLTLKEAVARAKKYEYVVAIDSIDGVPQGNAIAGGWPIYLIIKAGVVTGGYFEDSRPAR